MTYLWFPQRSCIQKAVEHASQRNQFGRKIETYGAIQVRVSVFGKIILDFVSKGIKNLKFYHFVRKLWLHFYW